MVIFFRTLGFFGVFLLRRKNAKGRVSSHISLSEKGSCSSDYRPPLCARFPAAARAHYRGAQCVYFHLLKPHTEHSTTPEHTAAPTAPSHWHGHDTEPLEQRNSQELILFSLLLFLIIINIIFCCHGLAIRVDLLERDELQNRLLKMMNRVKNETFFKTWFYRRACTRHDLFQALWTGNEIDSSLL